MLTVTETAFAHLAGLLYDADTPDDVAIRFVLEGRTITAKLDYEQPDDATYEYAGNTVLLLDEDMVAELGNRTLDIQDRADGIQFIFRQP